MAGLGTGRALKRLAAAVGVAWVGALASATAQEFRGLWVDAFHGGLRTPEQVTAVVKAARAKNFNAVIAQVRKRGDAYYQGGLEPVAGEVEPGFDPLADLIAKAHETTGGQTRLEVHAWLVTYPIWHREITQPSDPNHPWRRFPDWTSQKFRSGLQDAVVRWDGSNYQFDQGHPGVQQHTFDVAMDILRRYDIDGLHFDYLRYSDDSAVSNQPWGYHPVSVARFNALKKRSGTPLPGDAQWLQWRREQVSALLRKTYLHAQAEKPHVRISAALVCYDPAPSPSDGSWKNTSAYARVLQDWQAWLQEGILDLGCAMAYKTNNDSFAKWTAFVRDSQYSRATAIGLGWYLNPVEQTIAQVKIARTPGATGRQVAGVLGYSYAVTNSAALPADTFRRALTEDDTAELYDPGGIPVFSTPSAPPGMPWKADPSRGHLMGTVHASGEGQPPVDGALITLAGTASRTLASDGTGFFGAVDLPVGPYTLTVTVPGFAPQQRALEITGASVAESRFVLVPPAFEILDHRWDATTLRLELTWSSEPGRTFSVEFSEDFQRWIVLAAGIPGTGGTTSFQTPSLPAGTTVRFWRIRREGP